MTCCVLLRKFLHLFGIHKYYVIKELRPYSRKLGCKYCKKTFMMNDNVRLVLEWDSDFDRIEKEVDSL